MPRQSLPPVIPWFVSRCIIALSVVGLSLAVVAPTADADEDIEAPPFGLRNGQWIGEHLVVGGQPSAEQLAAVAEAGIRSVVNLRGTGEQSDWDESAHVADLGLPYLHIPIASADDLNEAAAAQLAAWLADEDNLPALVHCASGNRVGALFAFKAFHLEGVDVQSALLVGREHGMTSLYEAVAERLSNASRNDPADDPAPQDVPPPDDPAP